MIRIRNINRTPGLEEFLNELSYDEDKATSLTDLSDAIADDMSGTHSIESPALESLSIREASAGLESLAIAAAAAAAVAVLGIIYKVYSYFSKKKLSDQMSSTIEALDEDPDLIGEIAEAVKSNPKVHEGDLLKRNVALIAIMMNTRTSLIPELQHPKDFAAEIDFLPSIIEVKASANPGDLTKKVEALNKAFEKQYQHLKYSVRKFKITSEKIETGLFNGKPTAGWPVGCQSLIKDISLFSTTTNDKDVVTADELARSLFNQGLSETLKRAKREVEDLEEHSDRIAKAAEKAVERLNEIRRSYAGGAADATQDAVSEYIKYVKATTSIYKDNLAIIIRVNKYVESVAALVKDKTKD